jgi:hypothetical protein
MRETDINIKQTINRQFQNNIKMQQVFENDNHKFSMHKQKLHFAVIW